MCHHKVWQHMQWRWFCGLSTCIIINCLSTWNLSMYSPLCGSCLHFFNHFDAFLFWWYDFIWFQSIHAPSSQHFVQNSFHNLIKYMSFFYQGALMFLTCNYYWLVQILNIQIAFPKYGFCQIEGIFNASSNLELAFDSNPMCIL